jgi:hypothetical protein
MEDRIREKLAASENKTIWRQRDRSGVGKKETTKILSLGTAADATKWFLSKDPAQLPRTGNKHGLIHRV